MAIKLKAPILSVYDKDGNKIPVPAIKGKQGIQGEHGVKGNGITNVTGNPNGSFTFHYEDGTSEVVESDIVTLVNRAEDGAKASEQQANNAKDSADKAKQSETNSKASENQSNQNLSDLLAAIGTEVAPLVNGQIPPKYIPASAVVDNFRITDESELTGLKAQEGDIAQLVDTVDGKLTVVKAWKLLGKEPTVLNDWIICGTSYAVKAGTATIADSAEDSKRINGKRAVAMKYSEFETAVKDPETLYFIDMQG